MSISSSNFDHDPVLAASLGFPESESTLDNEPEPDPLSIRPDESLDWQYINAIYNHRPDYSGLGTLVKTNSIERPVMSSLERPSSQVVSMIHAMYADQKFAIEGGYPMLADEFMGHIPHEATVSERALMLRHISHLTTLNVPDVYQPEELLKGLDQTPVDQIGAVALMSIEKPISHTASISVEALKKEIDAYKELIDPNLDNMFRFLDTYTLHFNADEVNVIRAYVEAAYKSSDDHELITS